MAALTLTPTTMRQPFASLDSSRMRALLRTKMNLQNQQNGAIMSGKRQPLSEVDSENIDPTTRNLSTKRKRTADDDDEHEPVKGPGKPIKSSRMALTVVESTPVVLTPSTPLKPSPSTPKSTLSLKPAGRSPQSKPCKPFARRTTITKNRPDSASRKSVSRPFSIAAALSNGKAKSQSAPKTPASWSFEIHVDSEQEEMTNLMQHSTCVLDISDDEGKHESNTRGKENIPPAELGLSLPRSRQQESPAAAARKSIMEEESRSPLGELNAADYYGDDCHAFSYAVIYDEVEVDASLEKKTLLPLSRPTHPTRSKLSSVSSIASVLEAASPVKSSPESSKAEPVDEPVEIWESGSAAEEDTAGPSESVTA